MNLAELLMFCLMEMIILVANDVLDIINFTYSRTKSLLTYGSFFRKSDRKLYGRKYPLRSINKREFRKVPWFAFPLRTFRHDLYQNIDQNDLKDHNGKYYSSGWDVALMLPMLEMAEYRQEFIADPFISITMITLYVIII